MKISVGSTQRIPEIQEDDTDHIMIRLQHIVLHSSKASQAIARIPSRGSGGEGTANTASPSLVTLTSNAARSAASRARAQVDAPVRPG